jgi:hypothetical protein
MQVSARERTRPTHPLLAIAAAWAIPGLGHLILGRWRKAVVFVVAIPLMFFAGLWLQGRLFPVMPFNLSEPLVELAALADLGVGLVYFAASPLNLGAGKVIAVTYEYGNAFLIVAGLLNMLVILDAFDIALGRK